MQLKITQRAIASLEPTGSVQFLRDSDLQGFGIKVTAKGKASYFVEGRIKGGRTVRKAIGSVDHIALDQAKTDAKGMLYRLSKGIDISKERSTPAPLSVEPDTLQDALDKYLLTRVSLRETTINDYKKVFANCLPELLHIPIEDISKETVAVKHRELTKQGKSTAYVNKAMRTLKAVFNSTDLTRNPVTQFYESSGVTTKPTARHRYLSAHEISEIVHLTRRDKDAIPYPNVNRDFADLLMFYLLTGCRLNEALGLKKSDYNHREDTLTFRDTKSGRDHTIPCTGWIKRIVSQFATTEDDSPLFPFTYSTYRHQFDIHRRILGFHDAWTTHDLRRTFAEHCQLIGVDLHVISACLNHAPVGVTRTSYLGGGLAKKHMLSEVYGQLQRQYSAYVKGLPEGKYAPEDDLQTLVDQMYSPE
ncbi:MAG: integrase family protein [Tateyamaria sp.]|uniref:tyrosine-type recombinase/integrase n=1 Tax=Tateyamaria sp. TaxID=1929288 RepID=UPI00327F45DA